MFWVYVLKTLRGKFHVGQTAKLPERIVDHNRTEAFEGHFTPKNGPWTLVWSDAHDSCSSAVVRERQIKPNELGGMDAAESVAKGARC